MDVGENMRIVAKNMTDALVKIDSNGKDYYQANYRKLDAELAAFADSLRTSAGAGARAGICGVASGVVVFCTRLWSGANRH